MDTTKFERSEESSSGERVISLPPREDPPPPPEPPHPDVLLISVDDPGLVRKPRLGRPPKYPWDLWLRTDGYAVYVEHGVHFTCEPDSFYQIARKAALKRGYGGVRLTPLRDTEPCRLFALVTLAKT